MQEPSLQLQTPPFRQVHSGHGVQWWSSAWKLLFHRGAAAVWIVMCLIAAVIYVVLHVVPMLGWIAAHLAAFLFAGGLMLAARKTDQATAPAVGDLFAGFGPPLGSLVIGAALLMVAVLLIIGALAVAGAGAAFGAMFGGMTGNMGVLAGLGATSLLLLLAALVLLIPIGMAAWLAPALIVLKQQPPVEALKASLAACWANVGALAVYGLLWIAFAIVASIPLGLGWLVLLPLMALSTYAAYCDLFEAGTPGPDPG
ncbi:MAG TPA: BPSS1780 family membrane protein [Burkholderiaceae bacterium]|nr:BPSS1780 family membrane protein [Burkholderiaceae bacterium]